MRPDEYLRPVDGVDAQIWVPPTRGQLFWLRHAPALFGPPVEGGGRLARWWAIATVTPSTNVTVLSLRYQAYLDLVFHRTRLARVGHAVCMPLIVTGLIALYPPAAVLLAAWWLAWAVKERDPLWGAVCLAVVGVLYEAARFAPAPVALVLVGSLLQALSHIREPLPPRVSRSPYWIDVGTYVFGSKRGRVRRLGHLAAQTVFGTVDELVASPRLLPVLVLQALWRLGYTPGRRAAWTALAQRAIASGNPALDYIGTGGPTPLRVPVSFLPHPRPETVNTR